jgi:DNA-binding beta-propeller fold protein YncE
MGGTGGVTGDVKPAGDGHAAFDATPDVDATNIYFTALDPTAGAGVFKVPGDGSNTTPTTVAAGAPFVSPFGIAIGTDGKQLYVADPGADAGKDHGEIFVLPIGGGTPAALSGSEDTIPRGLEITKEGSADVIYFTGTDKTDGQPGVFKIPVTGGAVTVVAKGAPFVDPSGIAIAADGTLYVADTIAAASQLANIIKVAPGGAATPFLSDLKVGYPCGVALSGDDGTLLVSALDPAKGTDVLLQIDIGTAMPHDPVSSGIDTFYESAGLHRAKAKNVFAWADSSAGPNGGRVFVVK